LLLVPNIPNYPGYDFFYYDSNEKKLYLFQVTIVSDPMSHVISNDNQFNDAQSKFIRAVYCWRKFFLPSEAEMIEIWMIRNSESFKTDKTPRKQWMNVVYFEKIKDIPLLANLNQVPLDFATYCSYFPDNAANAIAEDEDDDDDDDDDDDV